MADFYMHSRLIKEVVKEINSDIDLNIAILGSQGPDPMYYKMFGENQPQYRKIADDIHRYNISQFLQTMTSYVKDNLSKTTFSYLVGYITHYAMDVLIHPYVYYNVGVYNKDKPETHHMRGLHLKFERAIDCLLIEKDLNIPARKLNLIKTCFPLKQAPEEVSNLYGYILEKEFKITYGKSMYEKSVKAMHNVLKYMNTDRFGIKKQIYKLVDLFSKERDMFLKDLSFYKSLEDYDYHNDAKKQWHHPLTNESYNYTVIDLFDQAKSFALEMIARVETYLYKDNTIDLNEVFPNLSYNSGKHYDQGMDFKYLNIYRK